MRVIFEPVEDRLFAEEWLKATEKFGVGSVRADRFGVAFDLFADATPENEQDVIEFGKKGGLSYIGTSQATHVWRNRAVVSPPA